MNDKITDFGFEKVPEDQKAKKVAEVFDSVAAKYDIMNDLMSGGLHRVWKHFTISKAAVKSGQKVLDIAGGTGDLSLSFAKSVGLERETGGQVWLTDINASMLGFGRNRLIDKGYYLPCVQVDAEQIPFPNNYFDLTTVAFGLRNMTHKEVALKEMLRVIKPGGKAMVLEFSKPVDALKPIYDAYSFKILPWLGEKVAGDSESYRYLAESIRMHPGQEELKALMKNAGFGHAEFHNLSAGVVALHIGIKC